MLHRWLLLLTLAAMASAAAAGELLEKQTFDRYSPLAAADEFSRRVFSPTTYDRLLRYEQHIGQRPMERTVDLAAERYDVWVPENGQSPGSSYDDRTYNQYNLITSLKLSSIYNGILSKKSDITYVYDTNQYPLSINNVHLKNVSTFPNPFSSSFSISYESNIATDVSMDLYDANGALITKTISTANVGENTITWDCGKTLPTGLYTYELHIGNETHSGKVLAK